MKDVFKEQIVKKENQGKVRIIKTSVIVFLFVLLFLLFPYTGQFTPIIMAVLGFVTYQFFTFLNVEYEYIFTNGELDIECIYSKSRRKRLFFGVVRDFDLIAHVEDQNHANTFNAAKTTKDYSSGVVKKNTYAILTTFKGEKIKIIFEPDEIMVEAFSSVITPRKFIKKIF